MSSGKVNTHRSSCLDIEQGVPQGSVLGPLLFLLYVNDLPKNVHDAQVVMFADDISVLILDSDARELQIRINRMVTELETWLNRNGLVINTGKSEVMSLHKGQPHSLVKPSVAFSNITVAYVSETRYLGIQITDSLNWHSHIQLLANKLSKVNFMMKSLRDILSFNFIWNIYFTKFHSLLQFCILLYYIGEECGRS